MRFVVAAVTFAAVFSGSVSAQAEKRIFIIANNARWAAVHRSTLSTYPKGHAAATKQPPFATLEPSPRFEHVIQASGGHGERVSEPKELMPALERALKVVREEKRQALLNVCLEVSYVKTS